MTFTGTQLAVYRNVYMQTGNMGFGLDCTVDNTTGQYLFGLSGNAGTLQFTLQSGRLYYGSQFIHTYQADEPFTLEAQVSTGHINVIKDGAPLVYGQSRATGDLDYFYFSRNSVSLGATFSLYVSGDNTASRTITTQGYFLTTGQAGVTGHYVNDGAYPINVFDSSILATQNYTFGKLQGNISASNTGFFAYTGDFASLDLSQPILTTFNTNYGDESVLFYITDATTLGRYVYITAPTDFTFNSSDVLNRDITWQNYSGGFVTANYDTSLAIFLNYVTGSGISAGIPSGFSVLGLGRYQQSGLLTGSLITQTGTVNVTGFGWATGAATGFFNGMGTGMASGINYTGLATGYMTGLTTGFIFGGSGTLNLTYPLVGSGVSAIGITNTGALYATGYTDISNMGDGEYFLIIRPNGSDYSLNPLARLQCNYLPLDPANCSFVDPQAVNTDFPTTTDLIECISGFSDLGINGVCDGANLIYWTATTIGTGGNGIYIWDDDNGSNIPGTGYTTGGHDGYAPLMAVYPTSSYTGAFPITITGSGLYTAAITGMAGTINIKTFTGSWSMFTGTSASSLLPIAYTSETGYFASGTLPSNSYINYQITYSGVSGDSAQLVITGADILNPTNQLLSFL